MKNAILLHGWPSEKEYYEPKYPSASNSHWFPWLQKQLMINDIKADTPEIFNAYNPNYEEWVKEIERFDITPETILVGHSMGGGFWVRYLTEHPEVFVDKVVLVAPWLNLGREEDLDFFEFELDPIIAEHVNELIIFTSDNDKETVQNSAKYIAQKILSATVKTFHNYGHFTKKHMDTEAFPELLEAIL